MSRSWWPIILDDYRNKAQGTMALSDGLALNFDVNNRYFERNYVYWDLSVRTLSTKLLTNMCCIAIYYPILNEDDMRGSK